MHGTLVSGAKDRKTSELIENKSFEANLVLCLGEGALERICGDARGLGGVCCAVLCRLDALLVLGHVCARPRASGEEGEGKAITEEGKAA